MRLVPLIGLFFLSANSCPNDLRESSQTPIDALEENRVVPFDETKVKDWSGLANLGNTCFINAAVKAWAVNYSADALLLDNPKDSAVKAKIRRKFRKVINFIRTAAPFNYEASRAVMAEFLEALSASPNLRQWTLGNQGDAQEFLGTLADELEISSDPDALIQLASLILLSKQIAALSFQPSFQWTLSGYQGGEIALLSQKFSRIETIEWFDPSDKQLKDAEKQLVVIALPKMLLVNINREMGQIPVTFNSLMTLQLFEVDKAKTSYKAGKQAKLAPKAQIIRRGNGKGGHYVANIWGGDGWYQHNDAAKPEKLAQAGDEGPLGNLTGRVTGLICEQI